MLRLQTLEFLLSLCEGKGGCDESVNRRPVGLGDQRRHMQEKRCMVKSEGRVGVTVDGYVGKKNVPERST